MGLNINGCLNAMRYPLVTAHSRHECAGAVRRFLEAGGMSTVGRPPYAWLYRHWLPTKGFNCIAQITGKSVQAQWTARYAQPGDIAVMPHGMYGHICMWSGKKWVSDFVQNNMWVYSGNGTCLIFRYSGQMDQIIQEPPLDVTPIANAIHQLNTCSAEQIYRSLL